MGKRWEVIMGIGLSCLFINVFIDYERELILNIEYEIDKKNNVLVSFC